MRASTLISTGISCTHPLATYVIDKTTGNEAEMWFIGAKWTDERDVKDGNISPEEACRRM